MAFSPQNEKEKTWLYLSVMAEHLALIKYNQCSYWLTKKVTAISKHDRQCELQNWHPNQHLSKSHHVCVWVAGVQDCVSFPGSAGVWFGYCGQHHGGPCRPHHTPHEDTNQLLPSQPGHSWPDGACGGRAAKYIGQSDRHMDLWPRWLSGYHLPPVPGHQRVLLLHHCLHCRKVRREDYNNLRASFEVLIWLRIKIFDLFDLHKFKMTSVLPLVQNVKQSQLWQRCRFFFCFLFLQKVLLTH